MVGVAGKLCGEGTSTQLVSTRSQPPLGRGTPERRLPWARRASSRRMDWRALVPCSPSAPFRGVQLLQDRDGEDDLVVLKGL